MWEAKVFEIRDRVKGSFMDVPVEKLNEKPSSEEWSIAQIVLHLAGAEKRFLTLALQSAESQSGTCANRADLSVFDDLSMKLKAPNEPSSESQKKEDLILALDESRSFTTRFLELYTKESLKSRSMNHHRFGDMPIWQVLELLGKHEQRHLVQIEEVKRRIL
ncbi:DinB family protein [Rossellomorea aquimaris]|uniref:DinB family protein n=1 Tax=Rossellomorea aquimaris TaxID=189382 RepID=UPI0005C7F4D2|nr:DinB family protein [Rossellomorea aquimaris]